MGAALVNNLFADFGIIVSTNSLHSVGQGILGLFQNKIKPHPEIILEPGLNKIRGSLIILILLDIIPGHNNHGTYLSLLLSGFFLIQLQGELNIFQGRIELDTEEHFGGLKINFAAN